MRQDSVEPIPIAIVGTGRIAADYLTALESVVELELVGVCDLRAEVANAVGERVTLNTNIYSKSTRKKRELPKKDRKTDVIEYLLKTIRPKIVLAYDTDAKKFFRKHCRDFVEDSVTPQKITWDAWQWQFRLLCSPHLGFRGWKHQEADEEAERIGQTLADALRLTTPTR